MINSSSYITDLAGCGCSGKGLSDTFTADQIPGNRLRLKKNVTVYVGHPGSSNTEQWTAGFLTPPVYSWVTHEGDVYWMIGELKPIRYVKHVSSSFELVADSGGAKFIEDENSFFSNLFEVDFEDFAPNINKILIATAIGLGAYLLVPVLVFSRKK